MDEEYPRVGLRPDSIILEMWDNMTEKEKADYMENNQEISDE